MTVVGAANFDINANPAKAIAALKQLQKDALATTGLVLTPTVDAKGVKAKLKAALDGIVGTLNAEVKIKPPTKTQATAALSSIVATLQAEVKIKPPTAPQIRAALGSTPASATININLNEASVTQKIDRIKTALQDLRVSTGGLFRIDADALKALATQISQQITDLRGIESSLRTLRGRNNGGGGSGTGGGGPGAGAATNPYAAQLRALQGDLKSSALSTDQYRAAVANLQTALNGEMNALRGLGVLTVGQQRQLDGLRTTSGQAAAALKGLTDQETRLNAAAQSDSVAKIGREIALANSKFQTGSLGLRDYLRELQRLEISARTLAPSLAADSKAALDLQRVMQGLGGAKADLNTQSIKNVRIELAQARTAYEQALAAAGSSWRAQGQAASVYQQILVRVEGELTAVGRRASLTREQALSVANLQRQLAGQQNALQGTVSPLGISGAFLNALRQIPALAMVAGGSLGAAASAATTLSGSIGGIAQAIGPLGIAIAAIGVALFGLTKLFIDSISHAAEFEKQLQQISGLAELSGPNLGKYADYVQQLSTKLPVTTEQLTEFGRQAVLVGLHGPEGVKTFTEGMANLSVVLRDVHGKAGGLEETGAEIVKVLRSMGMGTEEVNANFDKTINSLVALKTQFGVQIPDVTALATYFSSYAAKIGLTTDQILAFSASLVSVGARAQGSGSQLTKFFEKAAAAVASGGAPLQEFAKDLGLTTDATKDLLRTNPTKFLQLFAERLDVLHKQGVDSSIVLEGLGLDTNQAARTFNELSVAAKNTGRSLDIAKKGFNDAGLAARVAHDVSQNYIDQLKEMHNALDGFKANIGSFALPVLTGVVDSLSGAARALLDLSQEAKDGGPILDELRGYAIALAAAIAGIGLAVKGAAINQGWTALVANFRFFGGFSGILTSLVGRIVQIGPAISGAFSAAVAGGGAAVIAIGLVITAVAALAIAANKIISDTQRIYDQVDKSNQDSFDRVMDRVRALAAEGTELSKTKAKYLLAVQQLTDAEAGTVTGTNFFTGERIIKVDATQVKAAQQRVQDLGKEVKLLSVEDGRRAAAAKAAGQTVDTALRLTKEQLSAQESAIKSIRAELGKPVEVFGGTEFQNQLDQIGEKYKELRDKLRQDVLDPKQRNDLSRQLLARQGQEQGEVRQEYGAKASDVAGDAERQATQARIAAMADGTAKIKAQADFDIAELRRVAKKQADEQRDFPLEAARITAAAEQQALDVRKEATRKVEDFEKEEAKKRDAAAKKREAEIRAAAAKEAATLRKIHDDVVRQASLQRQVSNLNTNVGAKVDSGKLTTSGFESFTQQLADLKARIKELPVPLQATFSVLLKHSDALVISGKKAADYNAELKNLKGSLKDMGYDELLAAQKRVADDPSKQKSLDLISKEIQARQKLIKTHADQVLIEGKAQYKSAQGQATISGYEDSRSAVQGKENEAQLLLAIERKYSVDVLKARQQVAQASAEKDIAQINQTYGKEVALAHGNSAKIAELTTQRDDLIAQRRAQRDADQQRNLKQSNATLVSASNAASAELLKIDGQRAAGKAAVTSAESKSILDEYARRQDAAHGNALTLLKLEQELGGKVKEAHRQEVQESARTDIQGIKENYQAQITAAGTNKVEVARLAAERDALIEARRVQRNTAFKLLDQQAIQNEVNASNAATDYLLKLDGQRAAGKAALTSAESQSVLDEYARRQDAAHGNAETLLKIEQDMGDQVREARRQQAQDSARSDVQGIKESYQTLITAAGTNKVEVARLEAERDALIVARRQQRNAAFKLIDQQAGQTAVEASQKAAQQIAEIDSQREAGHNAVLNGRAQATLDAYAREQDAAQGNIVKLLQIEQQSGAQILAARIQQGRAQADADVRQLEASYQTRIDQAILFGQSYTALEQERDTLISQRQQQQAGAELLLAQQSGQALIDARKKVTEALLALDQSLASGLAERASTEAGRKKDQFDRDLANELSDLGDNERAKYDLLRSSQTTRIALAQRAVTAQEQADTLAENQRFENQKTALVKDGTYNQRLIQLEADHQARLTLISTKGIQDRSNVEEDLVRAGIAQLGKVNETEVKKQIDAVTRNLSSMTAVQRDSTRASLLGWLDTFQKAGVAGQAAVKLIQDALLGVANADTDARAKAVELVGKLFARDGDGRLQAPESVQRQLAAQTNRIGRPDSQQDAVDKASGAYDSKIAELKAGISDANKVITELGRLAPDSLDAVQRQALDYARQLLPIFEAQLPVTQKRAADAGQAAGAAYIKQFTDSIVKPETATADLMDKLARIGKPDTAENARKTAEGLFSGLSSGFDKEIKDLDDKIGKLNGPDISPDEQRTKDGLEATRRLYVGFLELIGKDAKAAGQKAFDGFTQTSADKAQQGNLALALAAKEFADANAEALPADQRPAALAAASLAYQKALTLYRNYWNERQKTAQEGFAKGTVSQEDLTNVNQAAAAAQKNLTTETVAYGNALDATSKKTVGDKAAEGELARAQAARELALAKAETLPPDQQGAELARISAAYQAALTVYRDYWNERLKLAQAGKVAGTVTEAELTEVSNKAAAAQKGLTSEVVSQNNNLDANNKKTGDSISALRQAREAYDAVLGLSAPAYQSEIDALQKLKEENGGLADQIDDLIRKYQQLQNARKGITVTGVSNDFQAGRNGGQEQLQSSVTSIAKGFGALTSPLSILSAILDKINPAGEILAGMFSVLEEPIKALQEPFQQIGVLLGSVIAPVLELIAPVLDVIAQLFTALYDAIASFIKAITFGFVNIDRRDPKAKETADQKGQGDQTQLDLDYRRGLISRQAYETQKFKLLKDGLDAQQAADLKAAGNNLAQRQQIERKYAQQYEKERLDMLDRLYEADLADLDGQLKTKEITEKQYAQKKYDLTHAKLVRERDDALALAGDSAEKRLQIEQNYLKKEGQARQEMLDQVYAAYIKIADDLGNTLTGGISTSLLNAAQARNFGQFRTEFRKNLRESIFQAVLSAVIESAAFGAILQPAIDALKAAFMTDGTADDDAAIQGLLKASDAVEGKAKQIYKALQPLRDKLGIGTDSSQAQQIEVTGNISTPEVKVSLDMLSYLADTIKQNIPPWRDAIIAHTPALSAETAALLLHVPALSAHTLAMPTFVSAVTTFGLHTTSLNGTAMLYSTATDRFVQGVNLWANASAAHIGAMNAHTAALRGAGSTGGTRKYQGTP